MDSPLKCCGSAERSSFAQETSHTTRIDSSEVDICSLDFDLFIDILCIDSIEIPKSDLGNLVIT